MLSKEEVITILQEIETTHNIIIIYAFLGGSRHFNTHIEESDYDIFYVYEGELGRYRRSIDNHNFGGFPHEIFLKRLLQGVHYYHIDNLQPNVVYIPNEKFTIEYLNELVPQIDINVTLLSLQNSIVNIYRRKEPLCGKYERRILRHTLNYLWIQENKSLLYPTDVKVCLEYFNDRDWYLTAKYILNNSVQNKEKSNDLVPLFKSIVEAYYNGN